MSQFDDIRPYNDDEVIPTIERLLNDQEFIQAICRLRFPKWPSWSLNLIQPLVRLFLRKQAATIGSVDDLQLVIERYMERMIEQTTSELTVSGLEHLQHDKAHLFISNHRDIAMDPAFVNWVLYHNNHHTLRIAIGDNLLTKPYVSDLMRLNKCFIVNRSASGPREKLKAAKHLSSYIHHSITQDSANIWIAQREGRAKDGVDRTNSAVIGMLMLSKPKAMPLAEYVGQLNIVPVSISYEWDACDIAKAQELYTHHTEGAYEKEEHEDAMSIARGITGKKGHVHVAFGEVLSGDYASTEEIVDKLDQAIIDNYILHPSNCLAYKKLHGSLPEDCVVSDQHIVFAPEKYTTEMDQLNNRLQSADAAWREILLGIYANPITSQLKGH